MTSISNLHDLPTYWYYKQKNVDDVKYGSIAPNN